MPKSRSLVCFTVDFGDHMLFDIEYHDKITPTLAVPEKSVLNGARM